MAEHKTCLAAFSWVVVVLASFLLSPSLFAQSGVITPEQWIKGDALQISVEEKGDGFLVRVQIGRKARGPGVGYADVALHLFDDQGAEMKLEKLVGERERWIEVVPNSLGSSWASGFFTCASTNGRMPAKATIEYKGEKDTLSFMKWSEWRELEDKKEKLRPR